MKGAGAAHAQEGGLLTQPYSLPDTVRSWIWGAGGEKEKQGFGFPRASGVVWGEPWSYGGVAQVEREKHPGGVCEEKKEPAGQGAGGSPAQTPGGEGFGFPELNEGGWAGTVMQLGTMCFAWRSFYSYTRSVSIIPVIRTLPVVLLPQA